METPPTTPNSNNTATPTQQGRIFVTGDIHGAMGMARLSSKNFPEGRSLTKDDYLFVLGELGLIWAPQETKEERHWLKWLSAKPWTTLFEDGNHENFDRLLPYPQASFLGGQASQVHDSVYYLRRGHIFNINGLHIFVIGGANSIDKAARINHEKKTGLKTWWADEVPSERDMNTAWHRLAAHHYTVDCIFTHTLPLTLIQANRDLWPSAYMDTTSNLLDHILRKTRFKRWYAAHMHTELTSGRFTVLHKTILELPIQEIQAQDYATRNERKWAK